jgi:hypothetical protein
VFAGKDSEMHLLVECTQKVIHLAPEFAGNEKQTIETNQNRCASPEGAWDQTRFKRLQT